jgi:hypothetical protein
MKTNLWESHPFDMLMGVLVFPVHCYQLAWSSVGTTLLGGVCEILQHPSQVVVHGHIVEIDESKFENIPVLYTVC